MSVTEPEFPSPATELEALVEQSATSDTDALLERIDELDGIDELVDWQLNRPEVDDEFDDESEVDDESEETILVLRTDDGVDVHAAVVEVLQDSSEPFPSVLISIDSPERSTLLALDHDDALALASYLTQAAALVGPTERYDLTTGDEQTGEPIT